MSFDAYSVAIRLKLNDLVTPALGIIGRGLRGLNLDVKGAQRSVDSLAASMERLKRTGLIGGALAGAGYAGLSLFRAPLEEAKQFQSEVARFASLGFGGKVNAEAVKFAEGMKTFGTSARENMTLVSDAMAVFKSLGNAEMVAPLMAKMKFANEAVFGQAGGANASKFMDLLKVVEFRGGLHSAGEFQSQANFVQKVIAGSRNRVDATALLTALKTGGVALSQRDNDAFYLGAEPLIQEFGGSRYGTGAMSVYQNLVQGRGTITAQQELLRLGLLDRHKVVFNSLGQLKKALPGAFLGGDVLQRRGELALLDQVLLPTFARAGITSDSAIINELGLILGNRTGSSLMSRTYQQRETLRMQAAANASAMGIDDLDAAARKTLAGQELELHAKWRDVMKDLGMTVLPMAIRSVEGLTSVIKSVSSFAQQFPVMTQALLGTSAAAFALAGAGGTLLMLRASFGTLGLVLGAGGAASGVGLLGAVSGLLGPVGLAIAGVTALAVAMNLIKPDAKDDGKDHPGEHWERNFSGRGGSWMPNLRTVNAFRGHPGTQEVWRGNPDGTGSYVPVNAVAPGTSRETVHITELHMDGRKVAQVVANHFNREASRPQTGMAGFNSAMSLPSPGG